MTAHGENITVYLQDIKWNEPSICLNVEPEYTALEIVKLLVNKTRQFNYNSYELAEIFVSSGQLCKERRLDMAELPYKVQGLWPKGGALAPDATYRFYLVRKGGSAGFLRSLSWTDCSHSIDVPLDLYLMKFLEQKKAGENYADLCSLPDLNETTLLDNLMERFNADTIYTYVGTILIAINPFKFFPIYNPKYVTMYQNGGYRLGELPPHIFAIANAAFTSMLDTQSDQCIVISGESGSGKTENTNFLLHHLTQNKQAQQQQNHHGRGVEHTLLGAGPVLEAFGNAKTVHNDNSSRFGKFIQVDFRKNGAVHGASVEKYLLEKSRIVSQAMNERNYHVFYYLLSGASPELARELFLLKSTEYHYLNQSGCYTSPGADEVHEFERLKRSMDMVGFKPELQKRIFAVISAILLLGNVEFVKKHTYHHDDAVQVKNSELVSRICKLLDVKEESFLEALTSKRTIAGGETMIVRYKLEDAISARNAMAKCLYGAIFDWIVWQINHALFQKQDHKDSKSNSIGVLDIFGFEDFLKNSFEQFCINFANEHLQYYFNQHIFKFEQEEYRREKIDWQDIAFIDNRRCLDLFAKRPSGLFFLLDEEGNFPGATNDTLLEKFHQNHKNSDFYEMPLRKENTFAIKHYAGKVKYYIQDFREKNSDLIHADLVSVLKNSNTGFVRELVGCDPVAMLRWSYVRLCMKCVNAFVQAGRTFHNRGGNKIGNIRRKTSVTQKHNTREYLNLPWSDNSETESGDQGTDGTDSFIHNTVKKTKRKHSARRRHKMYKEYRQFKTYQEVKNRETSKTKTPSVSLQFQKSLQSLLETLDRSHPYFVRCIKSNMDKAPSKFNEELVRRQLRYTGMLATVKLRQSGYNYRVLFEEFVQNYAALLPKGKKSTREDVDLFLTSMDSNHSYKNFQVGKSKVFLRETVKMLLDDALHHALLRHILRIQTWMRTVLARSRYMSMREAALAIQKVYRGTLTRRIVEPRLLAHREAEQIRMEERKLQLEAEEEERREQAKEERRQQAEEERRQQAEEERRQQAEEERRQQAIEEEARRREMEQEKRRQEAEEELRRSVEIEELERRRKLEAKELEERQKMDEAKAKTRLLELAIVQKRIEERAALRIQKWFKEHQAIRKATAQQWVKAEEHKNIVRSPSMEAPPITDIDNLAKSMDNEESLAELTPPDKLIDHTADSWHDAKSTSINGHDVSAITDMKAGGAADAPLKAATPTDSQPAGAGEVVKRRASITRTSAFRRGLSKDDEIRVHISRKSPLSVLSISSVDSGEIMDLISPGDVVASSPKLILSPATNDPSGSVDSNTDQFVTASSQPDPCINDSSKSHSRASSDGSELMNSKSGSSRSDAANIRQKHPELRSENIFYTPESKPPDLRHNLPMKTVSTDQENSSEPNAVPSPSKQIPDIVIDRKVPNYLPLELANVHSLGDMGGTPASPAEEKLPVRRTSSNDPGVLRRLSPKSETKALDLLSPLDSTLSPVDGSITRQSSRASSIEDDSSVKFTRTHVLRKNVQVRKSQSADNLASPAITTLNAEHDLNMKQGHKVNGQHTNAIKSQSHDHLTKKDDLEGQPTRAVVAAGFVPPAHSGAIAKSSKVLKRQESDDSDLGGSYVAYSMPLAQLEVPVEKKKEPSQPTRSGSKKMGVGKYHQPNSGSSQWSVSSTSEWNYPENLAITESEEISEIGRFIYDKYLEFRGNNQDETEIKSVYDRVFRDAMKEMYNMLITKSALALGNPNNFSPLKFRDLMSNFRDYVTANVAKNNVTKAEVKDFPIPIAINAFRGYLDEYQKKRRPLKRKAPKSKPKEHKKKPPKDLPVIKIKGHHMLAAQFTMPTFCEVCRNMMFWNIKDRGLVCENCKFSCHRRCSAQIGTACQHQPAAELEPNAVFGMPLYRMAGEDNSVPRVLEKLIAELDNRGVYVDGIYRKSGIASRAKALKKALDTDWEAVNLTDYAVHVISLTLKNFFRELPEPLFTFELYDEFTRCPDIPNREDAISAMRATVEKLPPINICVISRLMLHLARIAQNEATNRMSTYALAIVFAPGLVRTAKQLTAQESLAQVEKQCRTVELMLTATLKKLNLTLNDIDQLECEEQTLEDRLIDVRQSMRKQAPHAKRVPDSKRPPSMQTHIEIDSGVGTSDTSSVGSEVRPTTPSTPVDMRTAQAEEKAISLKIRNVQEKKDKLKMTIPRLTLTNSDGDDMQSADDIESSAESLDDIDYS